MRKILLILTLSVSLACLFAMCVGATVVISENNVDEGGDIVADWVCTVTDIQDICSVDVTYKSTSGEMIVGKIYYLIGLWEQQNKRQIENIYLPEDFDMENTVYFFDKIDLNGDGEYGYNELIKGTRGSAFYIKKYTSFEDNTFSGEVDVKSELRSISYSKYLTYFGNEAFSRCGSLKNVTYNGKEVEEYTCIISPAVDNIMNGVFGGDGTSLTSNNITPDFTRIVFEDRENSVGFGQYCFTRGVAEEIVFGKGKYDIYGQDRIALQFVADGSSEYSLKTIVVSKDTILANGKISWYTGEYDVVVLGLEDESASLYEANCKSVLANAKSVTYNPCYFGHTEAEDDFNCETALVCPACLDYVYVEAITHTLGGGIALTDLFIGGCTYVGCTNDGCTVREETPFEAVFEWKGYSASTYGDTCSLTQGYKINRESFNTVKEYISDFSIGVLAAVNKSGEVFVPDFDSENVISAKLGSVVNDYVDVKITGIPGAAVNTNLVFCIYAKMDGKIYYLENGMAKSDALGISYAMAQENATI